MKILKLIAPAVLSITLLACSAESDDKKSDDAKEQVIESKKGAWTDKDHKKMRDEIAKVESDLEALGEYKQEFIDCYTERVENSYESFDIANVDEEGCKNLAMECANGIMPKLLSGKPE